MKKSILRISCVAVLVAAIAVAVFSCNKERLTQQQQTIENTIDKSSSKPINFIIFQCKLHRPIERRPRDNKPCGCEYCFGICDVVWFPQIKELLHQLHICKQDEPSVSGKDESIVFLDVIDKNHARLYILEPKDFFEDEFGIDLPVEIPSEALLESKYKSVIIETGLYKFIDCKEKISYGNNDYQSFGYVDLNISIY